MAGNPQDGSLRVRTATRSDAARIAAIYSQSTAAADSTMDTEPVSGPDVVRWLDGLSARETILVGEQDGRVLGWGIAKHYSDRPGYARAAETSVYLDRAHLGHGIGSGIQVRLIAWCRQAGFHHLVAKIWADNEASIAFHHRFGYETVGVQREIGYVRDVWRNVAILQLILDSGSTE